MSEFVKIKSRCNCVKLASCVRIFGLRLSEIRLFRAKFSLISAIKQQNKSKNKIKGKEQKRGEGDRAFLGLEKKWEGGCFPFLATPQAREGRGGEREIERSSE